MEDEELESKADEDYVLRSDALFAATQLHQGTSRFDSDVINSAKRFERYLKTGD